MGWEKAMALCLVQIGISAATHAAPLHAMAKAAGANSGW